MLVFMAGCAPSRAPGGWGCPTGGIRPGTVHGCPQKAREPEHRAMMRRRFGGVDQLEFVGKTGLGRAGEGGDVGLRSKTMTELEQTQLGW
jgi:hypothetical protein